VQKNSWDYLFALTDLTALKNLFSADGAKIRKQRTALPAQWLLLHPLRLFYIFLALRKINLNDRLRSGRIPALHEVEALTAMLRQASHRA